MDAFCFFDFIAFWRSLISGQVCKYGERGPRSFSILNYRAPKTDTSQPGIKPWPPGWKASTISKTYSNSALLAIWNINLWAPYMAARSACGYMNIHEHTWAALRCRPNSTCKWFNPKYWHQALASLRIHGQARQITSGSPLQRDLTMVISILN